MASVPVGLQENCQAMASAVPCLKLWKSGMLYSSTLSSGRANCAAQTRDVSRRVYLGGGSMCATVAGTAWALTGHSRKSWHTAGISSMLQWAWFLSEIYACTI